MPMADLSQPITFRGLDLNSFTENNVYGQHVIEGTQTDYFDPSQVDLRQFSEPLALANGIDVGGVWLGARHVVLRATSYGRTRGDAYDLVTAIEPLLLPEGGTFGFYDLVYYRASAGGPVAVTVQVRPGGMRYAAEKSKHGGALQEIDDVPLAISWTCNFYAKNPDFS